MERRSILHMLDPMPNNSPFDANMALDAGFDVIVPYANVKLEDVNRLTQDAIFSRGPAGVKKTAIFIGGRDMGLAIDMLKSAQQAMVPPFEVSVFADPSGAYTTAAALVACVEKQLEQHHQLPLKGRTAVVFGGTGPVGIATGVIASLAGAQTSLVDHLSLDTAKDTAQEYNRRFKSSLSWAVASSDQQKAELIKNIDLVFTTAKAGIQVLSGKVLSAAEQLKVAGDVNAVPPMGIEGVGIKDRGVPLVHATRSPSAVGVGALAVGDVKYKLQNVLLKLMLETEEPLFLDFRYAFAKAQTLV